MQPSSQVPDLIVRPAVTRETQLSVSGFRVNTHIEEAESQAKSERESSSYKGVS